MNSITLRTLGVAAIFSSSTASTTSCLPCIDRSQVNIGVVHHGHLDDPYWDSMDIAIEQGAKDMGVNLVMREDPISEGASQDEINDQMMKEIEEYCTNGQVDAILVSLPNEQVLESLAPCLENNMPVAVFNSGYEMAIRDGIIYFGMDERKGGYAAGRELAR